MRRAAWAIPAGLLALATNALAQCPACLAHYPVGELGLSAGSLPDPGLYVIDYNYFYYTTCNAGLTTRGGNDGFLTFFYIQETRALWMTDWSIFGVNYGADLAVPCIFTKVRLGPALGGPSEYSRFGLGDIQISPLLLAKAGEHWDLSAGYSLTLPTGYFNVNNPASPGMGFYEHMFNLGGTIYFGHADAWAVSLMNHYEINQGVNGEIGQGDSGIGNTRMTLGQVYSLEAGLSRRITRSVTLGLAGYYTQQTTRTTASPGLGYAAAIGPELAFSVPVIKVDVALRYLQEFAAHNRTRGEGGCLTLTRKF